MFDQASVLVVKTSQNVVCNFRLNAVVIKPIKSMKVLRFAFEAGVFGLNLAEVDSSSCALLSIQSKMSSKSRNWTSLKLPIIWEDSPWAIRH